MTRNISRDKLFNMLLDNGLDRICSLDSEFVNSFTNNVLCDFDLKRKSQIDSKFLFVKFVYFFFGIFLSNVKYLLSSYKNNKIENCENVKYVLFPDDDKYIRFKHMPEILKDNYLIIYAPSFHHRHLNTHFNFFKSSGIRTYTPTFGFKQLVSFSFEVFRNFNKIRILSNLIETEFSTEISKSCQSGILMCFAYKNYIKDCSEKISNNEKTIIWFYDHDKDFKSIYFRHYLKSKSKLNISVHIQHGMFWGDNIAYTYPDSDYTFCCSEREKYIIDMTVDNSNCVVAVGAPLQSFNDICIDDKKHVGSVKTNIILLLTDCYYDFQLEVIKFLKEYQFDFKVRFRPASKENDMKFLGQSLSYDDISDDCLLMTNLISSNIVISFSADALFESFKLSKKTIWLMPLTERNNINFIGIPNDKSAFSILSSVDELSDCLNSYSNISLVDHSHDDFIKTNFGEFDFITVCDNYRDAIKQIIL